MLAAVGDVLGIRFATATKAAAEGDDVVSAPADVSEGAVEETAAAFAGPTVGTRFSTATKKSAAAGDGDVGTIRRCCEMLPSSTMPFAPPGLSVVAAAAASSDRSSARHTQAQQAMAAAVVVLLLRSGWKAVHSNVFADLVMAVIFSDRERLATFSTLPPLSLSLFLDRWHWTPTTDPAPRIPALPLNPSRALALMRARGEVSRIASSTIPSPLLRL